jgi:DNA recombination protein RmuC
MLEAAVVVLVIAVVGLAFLALRRPAGGAGETEALRNDINILRETNNKSIEMIAKQVQALGGNVQTALEAVRADVGSRLDANAGAMTQATRTVGDRVASVQATFAGLQEQVGKLSEQAREVSDLSRSISDLQRILSSPKVRGGFGEDSLETMLAQVFPREFYEMQYPFPSGEVVDAILKFPQGLLAIDSKFPLENFRRILAAESEADRKAARRDFLKDVRKRIDEVASKYIRPQDGTLSLALAYIPAENVYYEAIIRDEEGNDLRAYCMQRNVFPVSPNSLYAYLQTIVIGLNGMRISERAQSILRQLESLRVEMDKFTAEYETVGKHLRNATTKYDESARLLNKVETRVQGLSDHRGEQLSLIEAEAQKKGLGECLGES